MKKEQNEMAEKGALGRSWYHPYLKATEAEEQLLQRGRDGSFLVRPSNARDQQCTLSLKWQEKVIHIKIHQGEEESVRLDRCADSSEQFASVAELLTNYMKNPLRLKDPKINAELRHPFNNPDPTNERWFHGYMTSDEVTEYLTKYGKRYSYMVRERKTKPGNYVLCVRLNKSREPKADVISLPIDKYGPYYRVLGHNGEKREFAGLADVVEFFIGNPVNANNSRVVKLKHPMNTTLLTASKIKDRFDILEQSRMVGPEQKTGFHEEFMALQTEPPQPGLTKDHATNPVNKPKNRYKNILPYDQTRVVVCDGGPDYINANLIKSTEVDGDIEPEVYIACQGSLAHTMTDFWRMVMQENARIVAMTTKLVERGKNKCAKYWPDEVTPTRQFESEQGNIIADFVREDSKNDYILREFDVRREGENKMAARRVYQYHFIAWPDFGVPKNPGCVLDYLRDIRMRQTELADRPDTRGPIVIHCSAGIGRTGTVIVLDILIKQLMHKGLDAAVDIQETIRCLRRQREGMIQTEPQYRFLYLALEHYVGTMIQRMKPCANNNKAPEQDGGIYENIYSSAVRK